MKKQKNKKTKKQKNKKTKKQKKQKKTERPIKEGETLLGGQSELK